jgi:hypothetical protein
VGLARAGGTAELGERVTRCFRFGVILCRKAAPAMICREGWDKAYFA